MIRLTTLLLASSALAACSGQYGETASASETAAPIEQVAAEPAGEPELGTFGFDVAGMDRTVDAGDDFYKWANGTWAANTPIPEDKSNYGMFGRLDDLSKLHTRAIIEQAANDPASRVGVAYRSYLDTARIDALGLAPIQPWLDEIAAIESFSDYATMVGKADRLSIGGAPVGWFVGQDSGNSERYVLNLYQSGTGLPDRDYYLEDNERFAKTRAAYVDYLADMLGFTGAENARARAEAILAYETKLAEVHWDRNALSDSEKTYNLRSYADLEALAPEFDWDAFAAASGPEFTELNIMTPESVAAGVKIASQTDLQVLKDILTVRSLSSLSAYLPTEIDKRDFAFNGTVLSGTPAQQERWKRAVNFVSGSLRDDVGKAYAEKHFTAETKAEMKKLVDNVVDAMRMRIRNAEWMADATKAQAEDKLDKFTVKIGYPDKWQPYEGLTMVEGDAFGNALRARVWGHEDALAKLGEPLRRWEWGMAPMTVNAYANFGQMEIVFPAAILQPPFFDPNADPAINYGGIGAVIGHEISHHFDDQGAKYNSSGNLINWWSESDYENFTNRGKALVDQYNLYEVFPGEFVDGEFTLGENIGDLAGLAVAYDAYKASLGGKEAPVIDGFTGDQRFFMGWAQVWRRNYRDEELKNRLKTDSHSPSVQRTWVVRNFDAWYDAFGVTPEDKMYLPPEKRVTVW
ncbi:M13 family metallopeptidase [Sphingomicrobium nitratireducens]|uniref:M13 family metallopeptidase n=1 Tax=Sphingomicrobium nitratireducens TaxID=2964666 RepID=UPI00223FD44C|nr:M13 family metallopeptidase [Sphingomicrobium nitratireducens]